MPRLPDVMLRSNAARASDSGNTESIAGRSSPGVDDGGELQELAAVGLDDEVRRLVLRIRSTSGGSSATDTSLPPGRTTASERWSRSPPTVSKTTSTGSSVSSNRTLLGSSASCAPRSLARSMPGAEVVPDHVGALPARELRREMPHAPDGSVDQARVDPPPVPRDQQPLPRAQRGQGDGGTLLVAERLGLGRRIAARTMTYPAAAPSRSKSVSAHTWWPTATASTSGPTATTSPESSYDGVAGSRSTGHPSSSGVIAAACTRTSASPTPGSGVGIRSNASASGRPALWSRIAHISGAMSCSMLVIRGSPLIRRRRSARRAYLPGQDSCQAAIMGARWWMPPTTWTASSLSGGANDLILTWSRSGCSVGCSARRIWPTKRCRRDRSPRIATGVVRPARRVASLGEAVRAQPDDADGDDHALLGGDDQAARSPGCRRPDRRRPDPSDRRGTLIRLTRRGRTTIDKAVETHAMNEEALLRSLTATDRRTLDDLLQKLLAALERPADERRASS